MTVVLMAAGLALSACAGSGDSVPGESTPAMPAQIDSLDALGAAYLAAGGACGELSVLPQQAGRAEIASCGSSTGLFYSEDPALIDAESLAFGMQGQDRLESDHWLILDPDVEELADKLDGELIVFVPGPGPANMASDGFRLQPGGAPVTTPPLGSGEAPTPNAPSAGATEIVVYLDYLCPFCEQFEGTNSAYIDELVSSGAASYEVHPVAILDQLSAGTFYSTRATNAAACVADSAPEQFMAFSAALFANQPAENSPDTPTDDELIEFAAALGADIGQCQTELSFLGWVIDSRMRLGTTPMPDGSDFRGTPTVFVNGVQYGGAPSDAAAFQAFVTAQAAP